MSKTIKLKRGLDIKLSGGAEKQTTTLPVSNSYAVSPLDFEGITPRLLVREDDEVKVGSPLFFDRERPEILFTSPVSGKVTAVNRGEKRKILEIVVEADGKQTSEEFGMKPLGELSKEETIKLLLKSGLWPYFMQRPFGIVATPTDTPKAIFVSGFDSAPLAPDLNYILKEQLKDLQQGFDVLKKLTEGKVYLGIKEGEGEMLNGIKGVEKQSFSGPHPAGNVGIQMHHINPINKGEVAWTIDLQSVAIIGRFFSSGKLDMKRTYAITGSEVEKPAYVTALIGTSMQQILKDNVRKQDKEGSVRVINGNVLTGRISSLDGYVSSVKNQVTVISEGDNFEFAGWAMPRLNKFSVSKTYFSWLMPNKKFSLDTNLNGGRRAFIVTGLFEKYVPMDIYPLYLIKAIMAQDIDKMENLGIYEITEEDFALCEFVDPSKNDIQKTIRDGINFMIKELS